MLNVRVLGKHVHAQTAARVRVLSSVQYASQITNAALLLGACFDPRAYAFCSRFRVWQLANLRQKKTTSSQTDDSALRRSAETQVNARAHTPRRPTLFVERVAVRGWRLSRAALWSARGYVIAHTRKAIPGHSWHCSPLGVLLRLWHSELALLHLLPLPPSHSSAPSVGSSTTETLQARSRLPPYFRVIGELHAARLVLLSQVYLPREGETQTGVSTGTAAPISRNYIAGLRGSPDSRMEMVNLTYDPETVIGTTR
eukprot:6201063-Pleurochrysis_carterae.AAC.3